MNDKRRTTQHMSREGPHATGHEAGNTAEQASPGYTICEPDLFIVPKRAM